MGRRGKLAARRTLALAGIAALLPWPTGLVLGASVAQAAKVNGVSLTGGAGTRVVNGALFADPGASLTLSVTTDNDTRCVILSGALDDGTMGLNNVVAGGGAGLIQDPDEALYPAMPASAAAYVPDARILPLDEMGAEIWTLATKPVPLPARPRLVRDDEEQAPDPTSTYEAQRGRISGITCPECNGVLWEADENGILRFRCRIGHGYTLESLVAAQGLALEAALWAGLRALDERVALSERLSRRFATQGNESTAARYRAQADDAREQAAVVRRALEELIPEEVAALGHDER